ncbi:hypothetical protein QBC34DRAFT_386192 [Podospora aff. communis PSN243]|uniref:Uncharacterized protein n=1 Tax=Podospora aff. communis PSN243 TaxID=3040156 RepID=A0AAV9G8Z2_9PEZI|nr:hypothetical protein QBC34DRAFT_386192 [Podospora aff. communis PSN243]
MPLSTPEPPPPQGDLLLHRYLPGRLPTANPNPRGKHHRNPLPWRRAKLASAQCWDADANLWYRHFWDLQRESPGTPPPRPTKPHFLAYVEAGARRHKAFYSRCDCCWGYMMSRTWVDRKREWDARGKEGMEMVREGEEEVGGLDEELGVKSSRVRVLMWAEVLSLLYPRDWVVLWRTKFKGSRVRIPGLGPASGVAKKYYYLL